MIASAAIGLIIGIYGGWRHGSRFDVASLGVTLFAFAMPEFWFGILDADGVRWRASGHSPRSSRPVATRRPARGSRAGRTSSTCSTISSCRSSCSPWPISGEYALIMRNSLIDAISDEYVQTARAKGVQENRCCGDHVVPNAMLPTMTLTLLSIGFIFGGAITIEYVFSYPGLGLLTVQAIGGKD